MPPFTGSALNETLPGSAGADTLTGLGGNDTYIVNNLGDIVVEASGGGVDTVRTSVLDALRTYSIENWAYVENLAWTGTVAAQLKGNGAANLISANSSAAVLTADTLYGAAGDDTLLGYAGNDSLIGGSGDDVLDGGAGIDRMIGGTGNDRYAIDSTADRVYEYSGSGFDTIVSTVAKDLRVTWAQYVEGLLYGGTTAAVLHGNANGNRIDSTAATNDTLNGYAGNDTLDGGAGTDSMLGGLGDDTYIVSAADIVTEFAGQGIDTLYGAKTSLAVAAFAQTVENLFYTSATGAVVSGNALANLISGGGGNDSVSAGDGNDTVLGGAGADSVAGGNGDDVLYGASNPDTIWVVDRPLVVDTGTDTLAGGAGNDRYLIDRSNDLIVEAAGAGTMDVVISAIDNSLSRYGAAGVGLEALVLQRASNAWYGEGSSRADILVGNERDNYLVGGLGNDTLSARADYGNVLEPQSDVLDGGDGNDVLLAVDFNTFYSTTHEVTFFGGAGNDLYVIDAPFDSVGGQDTAGTDTAVLLSSNSVAMLEGVENIVLYGADAALDAQARAGVQAAFAAINGVNAIYRAWGTAYDATGNDLANTIVGNTQNNKLVGGAGNDSIFGGVGNDTLEGGTGTDSLVGGVGNDTYYLDTGDVAIEAVNGGFDILASASISTNAGFGAYANFEGWQYLGANAVTLNRGSGNVSNDYLVGGGGNDSISGFDGNDTLGGADGADTVLGGVGNDSMFGDAGNDALDGGAGVDTIDGGEGNDEIAGDLGDDRIDGGNGDDLIDGGGDWDRIDGGAGDDSAGGDVGNDSLYGGDGNDVLFGQDNCDELVGGAGIDELRGGGVAPPDGPDTSSHGDHLWGDARFEAGGGEADLFIFDTVDANNAVTETFVGSGQLEFVGGSTIGDFELGLDTIFIAKEYVGDFDATLDAPATTTTAGGSFSAASEIVFVRADMAETLVFGTSSFFDDIDAAAVDVVIGDATTAMPLNSRKLFVVDDGSNSAVFLFESNNGDAAVSLDELYLVTVVTGQSNLTLNDFALF